MMRHSFFRHNRSPVAVRGEAWAQAWASQNPKIQWFSQEKLAILAGDFCENDSFPGVSYIFRNP